MPRPNPLRMVQNEANLAERIAYERERRGWTYEGTAKRMTEIGCTIQGSAIYKIEKAEPRRRISVDELVAFAAIFETTVEDLLLPVDAVFSAEAKRILESLAEVQYDLVSAIDRCVAAAVAWQHLECHSNGGEQQVVAKVHDLMNQPGFHHPGLDARRQREHDGPDPIGDAYRALITAIIDFATEVPPPPTDTRQKGSRRASR